MTSNIGARQLKDFGQGVGFSNQSESRISGWRCQTSNQKRLKKTFSEFLNRIMMSSSLIAREGANI